MRTSAAAITCFIGYVSAHGVVTKITGANGVEMPGLSGRFPHMHLAIFLPTSIYLFISALCTNNNITVADGTPRDCSSNGCGSQADTSIIRDNEISSGQCGPLGRTQGNGPVEAAAMINVFMGQAAPSTAGNNTNNTGVGQEDNLTGATTTATTATTKTTTKKTNKVRQLLGSLLGGSGGTAVKGVKSTGPPETMVKSTAGAGSTSGLPTANEDGTVDLNFRQVSNILPTYTIYKDTHTHTTLPCKIF